jgi:hypothetical protein
MRQGAGSVHVDWVSEATSSHQLYDQNDHEDPEKQPARLLSDGDRSCSHRSGVLSGTEGSNSLVSVIGDCKIAMGLGSAADR